FLRLRHCAASSRLFLLEVSNPSDRITMACRVAADDVDENRLLHVSISASQIAVLPTAAGAGGLTGRDTMPPPLYTVGSAIFARAIALLTKLRSFVGCCSMFKVFVSVATAAWSRLV